MNGLQQVCPDFPGVDTPQLKSLTIPNKIRWFSVDTASQVLLSPDGVYWETNELNNAVRSIPISHNRWHFIATKYLIFPQLCWHFIFIIATWNRPGSCTRWTMWLMVIGADGNGTPSVQIMRIEGFVTLCLFSGPDSRGFKITTPPATPSQPSCRSYTIFAQPSSLPSAIPALHRFGTSVQLGLVPLRPHQVTLNPNAC